MDEESIFAAAIGLASQDERKLYLDQACGDNPALRLEVEELLQAHSDAGSFIQLPAMGVAAGQGLSETGADRHDSTAVQEVCDLLEPCETPGRIGKLGAYEIMEVVGSGGMGTVLRGFDVKLRRVVAVKVLSPQLAASGQAVKRFLREAQSAAAIHHDHVVTVHAVEDQHRPPFLVMEFVQGRTLQQKIEQDGELELRQILRIGAQTAAGLAAAHKQGLIHRDVKPANILLENGVERVKITDFGLARAADDAAMTGTGVVAGTPQYMSPEQAKGETVDFRSDLFSLGSVLYTMCVGRPAFRGESTMGVLRQVCDETPVPLSNLNPQIPDWLAAIVMRLLEKVPDKRFQTADETASLLEQCLAHVQNPHQAPLPVFAAELPGKLAEPIGWRPWTHWFGLLALLLLVPLLGLLAIGGDARTALVAFLSGRSDVPPALAIAPFNADQARDHQLAWAQHLGVPVKHTNALGMDFVLIPPGEFMMGSTNQEIESALKMVDPNDKDWGDHWRDCIRGEAPQHKVILTHPVYIGVHEVTQGQYQRVMGNNPSQYASTGIGKDEVAGLDTSNHPVEWVDWGDAAEFCSKLSAQENFKPFYARAGATTTTLEGGGYHLPTEAEWEFACRAGSTTKYWFGDSDEELKQVGWFKGTTEFRTHAVGGLRSNPFGLFDVHGNVWEWVADWGDPAYYHQFEKQPAIDPTGPTLGALRLLRGSSFAHPANHCRTSFRNPFDRFCRLGHVGFRVALSVEAVKQAIHDREAKQSSEAAAGAPLVSSLTPRLVLRGHNSWVQSLAFSPDGKTLATGSNDQQVRLWNAATGDLIGEFRGDDGVITSLAYSPDGTALASTSNRSHVRIWNAGNFNLLAEAKHDGVVSSVAFRGDSMLASASWDGAVKLWKWDGMALELLGEHAPNVTVMAFNPEGAVIATATLDGKLHLWDVDSGELLTSADLGEASICLAFSPDGKVIAAGGFAKRIELRHADTLAPLGTLQGIQERVNALVFLADGKTLVSAGGHFDPESQKSNRPGELKLWDVAGLKERLSVPGYETGVACLALSPDGKTLASGDFSGLARLWDVDALLAAAGVHEGSRPVLLLHFAKPDFYEEEGKTYVRDRSGNGHHCLCEQVQFTPQGKNGGGLAYDGKGFLRLPSSLIAGKSSFTIAAWVKPSNLNSDWSLYVVANKDYPTAALQPRFSFAFQPGAWLYAAAWNDALPEQWMQTTSGQVKVLPEEWIHIAVALERGGPGTGRLRLMLNGQVSEQPLQQVGGKNIGGYQDIVGWKLEGVLDEVAVWNRALPEAELRELFERLNRDRVPTKP